MELVKKSNFGDKEGEIFWRRGDLKISFQKLKISFRGILFPPPAVSVGRFSAFPRSTPDRKRNKSRHLRTFEPANAINPGIPGLEIPQTQ